MKAAVYSRWGPADVLQIRDVAKPVPNDNEVLIRVRAASVNPLDWRLMRGRPYILRIMFGLRKPKIGPGRDVAGQVEAVGTNVTQFKPGDALFGMCKGAFAEYACASESKLAIKPEVCRAYCEIEQTGPDYHVRAHGGPKGNAGRR